MINDKWAWMKNGCCERKLAAALLFVICYLLFSPAGALTARAQVFLDGREAAYDSITNTYLMSIDSTYWGDNFIARVEVGSPLADVIIGRHSVNGRKYAFTSMSGQRSFLLTLVDSSGTSTKAYLQFTYLPIVRLQGTFGYDYTEGTVIIDHPLPHPADTLAAARIKWRGATTNAEGKHKRNYKIKLNDDHQLFGLRNDNNWILDAGQADLFRLRNLVAMEVWNDMVHPPYYADEEPRARLGVSGQVVEVFLGREYRGIYNFSENMDRKQSRVRKVTKDGRVRGCLYKVKGFGYGNMNDTITTLPHNQSETWDFIEVKYPDLQDCDSTDWSTLYQAINFVVMSSDEEFANEVDTYFDLPVVVDYCLFGSAMGALDNRGKNMFWAVYDKNTDRRLTPAMWDLDCTVGQEWLAQFSDIYPLPETLFDMNIGLVRRLCQNNVLHFVDTLNSRYAQLRATLLATDSLTARYRHYHRLLARSGAAQREEQRWSGDSDVRGETIDFAAVTENICQWIREHMEWMDRATFPLGDWVEWYETGTPTPPLRPTPTPPHNQIYTLSGQRVKTPTKAGIYIVNGRLRRFAPK